MTDPWSDEQLDVAEARGFGLHWPSRDADLTIAGLMNGVFGTRTWMGELARRAGRATAPAKAAARANGAKGGRPRKVG